MQVGDVIEVKAARKQHACWFCGKAIEKGSAYVRWTWYDGDQLVTTKVHPPCRDRWHEIGGDELMFAEGAEYGM